ncbi:hypothetical protein JXQ31_00305 [candidate division KSB1 bacterium]|nr:hypothetical protein [candidate division KSB1 bacterium]
MDFITVNRISVLLAKSFAGELLKLLVIYKDISASEVASRLDLHIKTAQDFLEELFSFGIADRKEVYERKRPYYRYTLKKKKLNIEIDFTALYIPGEEEHKLSQEIRERIHSGAMFSTSGKNSCITSVTIFTGDGREKKERKINLTLSQGQFLYHLPFPNAGYRSIKEIMEKAGTDVSYTPEILDIVGILTEFNIIESSE